MVARLLYRAGVTGLLMLLLPVLASAAVRTVRRDGSGDYLTILQAVTGASSGDTIDVGHGTYNDYLEIRKRLVLLGSSGPEATILDGEGIHQLMIFFAGSGGSSVAGFTFSNAFGGNGGAVRVQDGSNVIIRNCKFINNIASYDGSAFFIRHSGSHLTVEDCTFTGNHTGHNGGAGNIIEGGLLDVARCTFHHNSTDVVSGALAAHNGATMNISECLFEGNESADVAGAVYYYRSSGSVRSNTFDANASPGSKAATVFIQESPGVAVEKNVITNAVSGCGLWDEYSSMVHTCNLYWEDASGAVGGQAWLGPTEIVADPQYCDAASGDYTIAYQSAAAPEHSACGVLVGAFEPACEGVEPPAHVCTTIKVRQDGSGDYLTLSEAYAAAYSCDTIDVGPGTYSDVLSLEKRLSFVGSSGAQATILDGGGTHELMIFSLGSTGSSAAGFTFTNGHCGPSYSGGAVRVKSGSVIVIRDCIFTNNVGEYDGGAFFVHDAGSHLTLEDCTFTGNHSVHNGGAGNVINGGILDIARCTFRNNSTDIVSGALAAHNGATMNIATCLFEGNESGDVAGAVYYYKSSGSVRSSTFDANASPGDIAATIVIQRSPEAIVEKNIITNAVSGYGLWDEYSSMVHTCNLYWENASGAVNGEAELDPTEVVADPLYCETASGDYTIAYESQGAPENNACGVLIGAFAPTCHREGFTPAPTIVSTRDVPRDEGGQVRIIWGRSTYDSRGSSITIHGYAIYRKEPAFAVTSGGSAVAQRQAAAAVDVPARAPMIAGWDYVMTIPARGDDIYQAIMPTLCDSTINGGMCWSIFFISAMTEDPLTFWDSPPDSGYSVDNLAPAVPLNVSARPDGEDMRLSWDRNAERDLAFYRILRGDAPNAGAGSELLTETTEHSFIDASWNPGDLVTYSIMAVDSNGNSSGPAQVNSMDLTATTLTLFQNYPNPFNPMTSIAFYMPEATDVRIEIYDIAGRLISSLANEWMSSGLHAVEWRGTDDRGRMVASGMYFYTLTTTDRTLVRKMILLR